VTQTGESPVLPTTVYQETIAAGGHRSFILKAGKQLRLTDTEGGANLTLMALNAQQLSERLNLPDTLKAQHTAYITAGHCLHSDMGRVLLAVTEDSCGWHDCFGGVLNAAETDEKYSPAGFGDLRNDFHRNGYDNLLVEMGKWDLDVQDIQMVVNFFSKVAIDAEGTLAYVPGHSKPGNDVVLYAPMDTLVFMTAVPHPMDPSPVYAPRPVQFAIEDVQDTDVTAQCRKSCAENARAFHNTELFRL